MILNILFILSILFSGIYSFINFREFMDVYEIAILVFSVPVFIWLGYFWSSFRKLFLATFVLTILSVFIFQNDLQMQETNFFLKYFLSSQSLIMWMTFFFPLSLASYLYSSFKFVNLYIPFL